MKVNIKEFIKSASLNIVGGIGMIIWTFFIIQDWATALKIVLPMTGLSILILALWLFAWDKIERKIKKRKNK